jgi:outer membrane protein TolC
MKNLAILILSIFITQFSTAQEPTQLTVEQAVSYAKEHNATIKNAVLEVDYSKQTVKSIVATGLPQINANGTFLHNVQIASQQFPDFISPSIYGVLMAEGLIPDGPIKIGDPTPVQFGAPSTMMASISMQQLLFDGTYFLGLKAAKEYVNLSAQIKEQKEIDVVTSTRKAFYGALIAEENLKLMTQSLQTLNNTLSETEEFYKAGLIEKLDVDRLKLSRNSLKTTVENLKGQQEMMLLLLKLTIGMPISNSVTLIGDVNTLKTNGMVNQSFDVNNRIENQILEQQLTLDSMNIKRFKVGYIPSLYLNVNHQQNSFANAAEFKGLGNDWYPGTSYSVSLNVPIFDGFYKKAKISEATIKMEQDRNQLEATRNALSFEVAQAEINYRTKQNTLTQEEEGKILASNIYNTASIKFKEGVGSSLELSQAESDKSQSEIRYSNALYELMIAQIELNKALGNIK